MSDIKPFIWAQGQDANVREPIQALKESGWRYGDVPTASNFNWLFKMLTEDLASLRKALIIQKEEFEKALLKQAKHYEDKLTSKIGRLDTEISIRIDKLIVDSDSNKGVLRKICMLLRQMEKALQHYHANFPSLPWPLNDDRINAHEDENT